MEDAAKRVAASYADDDSEKESSIYAMFYRPQGVELGVDTL